jgi:hypothetical protein
MLEAILNIVGWFFLISGVIAWLILGIGIWLHGMDRR